MRLPSLRGSYLFVIPYGIPPCVRDVSLYVVSHWNFRAPGPHNNTENHDLVPTVLTEIHPELQQKRCIIAVTGPELVGEKSQPAELRDLGGTA